MSQDNRLLPLTPAHLNRPLRELTQPDRPNNTYATPEPTNLRDYLQVVLKRKWLILSLAVVVTSLAAIYMYRQPSIYEAETTVQIEQKNKNLVKTPQLVINAANDPTYWTTQLKLLENPRIARKVILTLGLENNPSFLGGSRPGLFDSVRRVVSRGKQNGQGAEKAGALPVVSGDDAPADVKLTPEQAAKMEVYENYFSSCLQISPVERTSLVAIRFQHPDPQLAMKITDTLANVFIEDNYNREVSGSSTTATQIAEKVVELQIDIKNKEQAILDFKRVHNLPLSPQEGADLSSVVLRSTTTEMLAATTAREKAEADYEAAQKTDDPFSVPAVQEDKNVQELRGRLDELDEKRAELLVTYTAEHPSVKKIEEQRKHVEQALNRQAKASVGSLRNKYLAAKSNEDKLRSQSGQARAQVNQRSQSEMQLANMMAELETEKQMYQTYLQRQREQTMAGGDVASNVSIATPARQPRLVGPMRTRNIIIALLLSLAAGIGLAFLLDFLDDTLKSIEDVDRHIHLPTLALIPASRTERRTLAARASQIAPAQASGSTALALIEEVRSPVAEAYRHLRTSLLLSSAGQPPRTILVTSSQPSEGKTTTAVNIAVMLAQTGARVLLMDCDLRRPRVHTHFQLPNARGVTNYLSGEAQIDLLVQEYEKFPNLKIITSGPVPPNAAELLGSKEMERLLHLLSEDFQHIVIDSPPAISFTDASILSTMVNGVMLVVHGGRSSRAVVRRAKQQLLDVGAHIFGIVLNNVKHDSPDYYGGYYSNYYSPDDGDEVPADTLTHSAK